MASIEFSKICSMKRTTIRKNGKMLPVILLQDIHGVKVAVSDSAKNYEKYNQRMINEVRREIYAYNTSSHREEKFDVLHIRKWSIFFKFCGRKGIGILEDYLKKYDFKELQNLAKSLPEAEQLLLAQNYFSLAQLNDQTFTIEQLNQKSPQLQIVFQKLEQLRFAETSEKKRDELSDITLLPNGIHSAYDLVQLENGEIGYLTVEEKLGFRLHGLKKTGTLFFCIYKEAASFLEQIAQSEIDIRTRSPFLQKYYKRCENFVYNYEQLQLIFKGNYLPEAKDQTKAESEPLPRRANPDSFLNMKHHYDRFYREKIKTIQLGDGNFYSLTDCIALYNISMLDNWPIDITQSGNIIKTTYLFKNNTEEFVSSPLEIARRIKKVIRYQYKIINKLKPYVSQLTKNGLYPLIVKELKRCDNYDRLKAIGAEDLVEELEFYQQLPEMKDYFVYHGQNCYFKDYELLPKGINTFYFPFQDEKGYLVHNNEITTLDMLNRERIVNYRQYSIQVQHQVQEAMHRMSRFSKEDICLKDYSPFVEAYYQQVYAYYKEMETKTNTYVKRKKGVY